MSEFRKGRSNAEVRKLKEWGPGRLAQLKLFISHLESAFDTNSLAAQVLQSPSRKFSAFVPKIVQQDIGNEVEFREIRVFWNAPRGLRNFFFYEIRISLTDNFASFDTFISFDPFYVFPNLLDGRTYYVQIRVVTKNRLFGPWSDIQAIVTPFSQGYGFYDGTERSNILRAAAEAGGSDFQEVFAVDYEAIGGSVYFSVNYEFEPSLAVTDRHQFSDGEFRWMIDGAQVGQNFLVTGYGGRNQLAGGEFDAITADIGTQQSDSLSLTSPFKVIRRGTFIQKLFSITAGDHVIALQGRSIDPHPTPNDWIIDSSVTSPTIYGRRILIRTKHLSIFESLIE